jgi:hypothetical protein
MCSVLRRICAACRKILRSAVIIEREDDHLRFIASCVELPIDGYGNTVKAAESELYVNICVFLYENFRDAVCKESFCENLYLLAKSNSNSSKLLDKYRALQYLCAKKNVALTKKLNTTSAEKGLAVSSLIATPLPEAVNHTVVEYSVPKTKGKFAFA